MRSRPPARRRPAAAVLLAGIAAGVGLAGSAGCKKEAAVPAAATPPPADARPTHTFDTVTFAYPTGWTVRPADEGKGVIVLGPDDGKWGPTAQFTTFANPEGKSLDERLAEWLEQASRMTDFESKGTRTGLDHPGGFRYGRFACVSKAERKTDVELAHWFYVLPLPDKRWLQVQASAAVETRDKYEPVFQALVDSVTVKK